MADAAFGITIDQVKDFLGIPLTDTSKDLKLQLWLDTAVAELKLATGRNLEFGVYRDTFQYRHARQYLHEAPVESIETITMGTSEISEDEFILFKRTGLLHFKYQDQFSYPTRELLPSGGYLVIEYVGGYQELPANMQLALYNAIQYADSVQSQIAQFGAPIKRLSVYDVGVTDLAVPKDGTSNSIREYFEGQLSSLAPSQVTLGTWELSESEYVGPFVGSPT